ncbi:MAG TPA: hypothetical protein PKD12_16310 [Nitrospira sp.]|nr:hypothetical protein [Nitrospira sp.]
MFGNRPDLSLRQNNQPRATGRDQKTLSLEAHPFSYPRQTFQLLRRFFQYMPIRDVLYLLLKLFMGQKKGATKAEVVSLLVEHADMKDAAPQLTRVSDEMLHNMFEASRLEHLQIRQAVEESRELPMIQSR